MHPKILALLLFIIPLSAEEHYTLTDEITPKRQLSQVSFVQDGKLTIKDIEILASETKHLDVTSLLYNQSPMRRSMGMIINWQIIPRAQQEDSFSRCFDKIRYFSKRASVDLLEQLITHENARVRTLGVYMIYEKEDPTLLPLISSLLEDSEQTFPLRSLVCSSDADSIHQIRVENSIVATHANKALSVYKGRQNFEEYWEERKDRDYCASWIRAKFKLSL